MKLINSLRTNARIKLHELTKFFWNIPARYFWYASMGILIAGTIGWRVYSGLDNQAILSIPAGIVITLYAVMMGLYFEFDKKKLNLTIFACILFSVLWVYGSIFWFSAAPSKPLYGLSTKGDGAIVVVGDSDRNFIDPAPFRNWDMRWYNSDAPEKWDMRLKLYNLFDGKLEIKSKRGLISDNLAKYGLSRTQDEYDYDLRLAAGKKMTDLIGSDSKTEDYLALKQQLDDTSNEIFYLKDTVITFTTNGRDVQKIQLAP